MTCSVDQLDHRATPVEERRETWPKRSSCSGGTSSLVINADGNVLLCEQVPNEPPFIVGNLRSRSILDVWNSDRLLGAVHPEQEKFEGTACFDCDEFDECHTSLGRCFRDALMCFGTCYAPPPACPRRPSPI